MFGVPGHHTLIPAGLSVGAGLRPATHYLRDGNSRRRRPEAAAAREADPAPRVCPPRQRGWSRARSEDLARWPVRHGRLAEREGNVESRSIVNTIVNT